MTCFRYKPDWTRLWCHVCSSWSLIHFGHGFSVCSELSVNFSPFSPFAAVSLFGVAGLAETFPSFSVSGPFLLDFPGFQVPSDSIFPSQLWSSYRALPLHLHFDNCSDVFSLTSPFDVSKPFQPSTSHNRRYRFHLCFFQDFLISPVFSGERQSSLWIWYYKKNLFYFVAELIINFISKVIKKKTVFYNFKYQWIIHNCSSSVHPIFKWLLVELVLHEPFFL